MAITIEEARDARTAKRVWSLGELYRDRSLYTTPDMFSPPSERLDHVIRFELTQGCMWGRCTYCSGYKGVPFCAKTPEEYRQHVDDIWARIGTRSCLALQLTRIFVGGGNALSVDGTALRELLDYTRKRSVECTDHRPKRIAVYSRTADILKHGEHELYDLVYYGFLHLVYWGVESGSDEVLAYVNKGCTYEAMVRAGRILRYAYLNDSVMIMTGLGGMKYYRQHVEDTASLLSELRPRFITFMGINAGPDTAYTQRMRQEEEAGKNRPLTQKETAEQMVEIIDGLRPAFQTKIGCFDRKVDAVGCNPLTFGSQQIVYNADRDALVQQLQQQARRLWP